MDGVVQIGDRADVVRDDAEPWTAVTRDGGASEAEIVVSAFPWINAGHELHHRRILRERYGL